MPKKHVFHRLDYYYFSLWSRTFQFLTDVQQSNKRADDQLVVGAIPPRTDPTGGDSRTPSSE